ncbi:MAG: NADH:ubiquinone reductase (Na(+)-transporting) subunit F [Alphaproteobacteria bacterium]|nr:NADH:ubiquinone reductase (Na(+)-transporting) subunit F [Alphaproteobacteria bacterium]
MTEIVLGTVLFTAIVLGLATVVMGARALLLPATEVKVTVNQGRDIAAVTGRKLLAVLDDAGIHLPSTCGGAGTCGLCRVTITDGGTEPLPTEVTNLSRPEISAGMRLACQVVLRGDLEIHVPEELFEVETALSTVASARTVAPLIKEIVLALPQGVDMEVPAGAFIQVTAPPFHASFSEFDVAPEHQAVWDHLGLGRLEIRSGRPVTRAYSVANRPADRGTLVLDIRLALPPPGADVPPGVVSSYLFGLKPGDTLEVAGPYGSFRARASDKEMVFIGGGVGMAPLRAIIFDQLERLGSKRKITFWYGARSLIELFYAEEFDELAARHENFAWTVALSDPKPEDRWEGATGFIHEVVLQNYLADHPAPEDCEYYLCGPPLMIKAVFAMLDNLGVDRDNILFDDFGS